MKMMHMYITLGVLLVALIAAVVMVVVERRRHERDERCTEGPIYSCASEDNYRTCFGSNPPAPYEAACMQPLGPVGPVVPPTPYPQK